MEVQEEDERDVQMRIAADERRRARRAFQKARNASSLANGRQGKREAGEAFTRQSEDDWAVCAPLQCSLLSAEVTVLEHAVRDPLLSVALPESYASLRA